MAVAIILQRYQKTIPEMSRTEKKEKFFKITEIKK